MLYDPPGKDKHFRGVMNHIALGVPDIHAAEAQLRKNGWTGTEQPKIGRDGKWQLNLYDPDDTCVEFMEFTPTQKPCCSEYTGPHPKPSLAPALAAASGGFANSALCSVSSPGAALCPPPAAKISISRSNPSTKTSPPSLTPPTAASLTPSIAG